MTNQSNKNESPNPTPLPPPQSIGEGESADRMSESLTDASGRDLGRGRNGWVHTHTDRIIYDDIKERARTMRKNPTLAEDRLWSRLRRKQVNGFRFRRQTPIGQFIVDFYCADARLVLEVDGSIHNEPEVAERDDDRQKYLESLGLRVVRFTNDQIMRKLDAVIEQISELLVN